MVFATDPTRTVNLEQNETPVSKALSAVGAAELAIANALMATAGAVVSGEVKPCACLYNPLVCAQEDLQKVRSRLENPKVRQPTSAEMAEVLRGLMGE